MQLAWILTLVVHQVSVLTNKCNYCIPAVLRLNTVEKCRNQFVYFFCQIQYRCLVNVKSLYRKQLCIVHRSGPKASMFLNYMVCNEIILNIVNVSSRSLCILWLLEQISSALKIDPSWSMGSKDFGS